MKTTVIYHSSDFDGRFCCEIARKFLPDATLIGWNHGDDLIPYPSDSVVYVMDLPVHGIFKPNPEMIGDRMVPHLIWIDHHKSAIESHPKDIPGYRVDGVAACRLAWQWLAFDEPRTSYHLPPKQSFVDRIVKEPLAVRLAGEYDIFDKRDPRAELFQFGLKSQPIYDTGWSALLDYDRSETFVNTLLGTGKYVEFYRNEEYREVITSQGFDVEFEGFCFLACCSHECDIRSQLFKAAIEPHHDGLLGFTFTGTKWRVSLYGVPGKPDIDLSVIARKHGGGGHKQACGFTAPNLPWLSKLHLLSSRGLDLDVIRDYLESVVPDRNCTCQVSPPCGWCVEYGHIHEQLELLRGKK